MYVIIRMKKGNDKFTISVSKKIKEEFKRYCEEHGLKPGKQLEKYMEGVLVNR